jgi:hypothetical protein
MGSYIKTHPREAFSMATAVAIGASLTLVLTVGAYLSSELGAQWVSSILTWPNTLLQGFLPCNNVGTPAEPFCASSGLNVLVDFASLPLSVVFYSVAIYVVIWKRKRRRRMRP